MADPLLELEDVEARYGPVKALHGVTLRVGEGEIVAVLGANGAGKTTTLRAVSGTVRRAGRIAFAGRSISRRSPEAVARLGIAHVPEGRGTLTELSVRENLRLGAYVRRDRKEIREDERRVLGHFPWLERRGDQRAGTLSGGEQQMLALARALMLRPKLVLLDEPSLGLAPLVVSEIFRIVRELNEQDGLAVLVVEQNATLALEASTRAYVLEVGRVAVAGESEELRRHESVRRSYLGY
jgi:branched-chain amino acid transport system ATP-binding protein